MAKTKSSAAWHGLSAQQRRTLEEWLFEDGLSYDKALERAKKELGFKGTRSSLRRFYEERSEERTLLNFAAAGKMVASVEGAEVSLEAMRDAGMKVAAQVFFKLVTERPEQAKDWLPLAKLLAQGERNNAWREVKDAENEIRRAGLDFARLKHQYDMIGQALKALPELEEMEEAQRDPEVTKYERNRRMNDLRKQMFGEAIPELLPETPEEEAHPELVEQKMAEAKQRQNEEWVRQQVEIQKEHAELRRRELERRGAKPGAGTEGADEGEDHTKAMTEDEDEKYRAGLGSPGAASEQESTGNSEGGRLKTGIVRHGTGDNPLRQEASAGQAGAASEDGEEDPPSPGFGAARDEDEMKSATAPETVEPFVDEPRKLTPEEREQNYRELMRRARGG